MTGGGRSECGQVQREAGGALLISEARESLDMRWKRWRTFRAASPKKRQLALRSLRQLPASLPAPGDFGVSGGLGRDGGCRRRCCCGDGGGTCSAEAAATAAAAGGAPAAAAGFAAPSSAGWISEKSGGAAGSRSGGSAAPAAAARSAAAASSAATTAAARALPSPAIRASAARRSAARCLSVAACSSCSYDCKRLEAVDAGQLALMRSTTFWSWKARCRFTAAHCWFTTACFSWSPDSQTPPDDMPCNVWCLDERDDASTSTQTPIRWTLHVRATRRMPELVAHCTASRPSEVHVVFTPHAASHTQRQQVSIVTHHDVAAVLSLCGPPLRRGKVRLRLPVGQFPRREQPRDQVAVGAPAVAGPRQRGRVLMGSRLLPLLLWCRRRCGRHAGGRAGWRAGRLLPKVSTRSFQGSGIRWLHVQRLGRSFDQYACVLYRQFCHPEQAYLAFGQGDGV